MIYKVKLAEAVALSGTLEEIYIDADSIVEAVARATKYGEREWKTNIRVTAVEEVTAVIVDGGTLKRKS